MVSAEFSSDLSHIVTAASDGVAKIWNCQTRESWPSFKTPKQPIGLFNLKRCHVALGQKP